MKDGLKELQRIIGSDKAVKEWFKSVNNQRTIYNYRADFPNFLKYVRENSKFKTPSEILLKTSSRRLRQTLLIICGNIPKIPLGPKAIFAEILPLCTPLFMNE